MLPVPVANFLFVETLTRQVLPTMPWKPAVSVLLPLKAIPVITVGLALSHIDTRLHCVTFVESG